MNEGIDSVEACAKLILCGEHFVLHGAPAIALPLPSLRLRLERGDAGELEPSLLLAWNAARSEVGLGPSRGFPFLIRSGIPRGVGLGSSAALAVALVKAATIEAGRMAEPLDVAGMATTVEDVFHGNSSGLDPTVVAVGRLVLWRGKGEIETVSWDLRGTSLLVARIPSEGTTGEAVERSLAFAATKPEAFAKLLAEARELSGTIAGAVSRDSPGSRHTVGKALSRYHRMLSEIGVSCASLNALVESAEGAGAYGAKLTGAGLGGCMMALTDMDGADPVEKALKAAGAMEVIRT